MGLATSHDSTYLDFEKPIIDIEIKIREFEELSRTNNMDFSEEIEGLKRRKSAETKEIFSTLSPWQRVELARHPRWTTRTGYSTRSWSSPATGCTATTARS